MTKDILRKALPNLTDPKLLDRLLEKGQFSTFEPGKTLMEPGQFVKAVPLVLDGSIKIMRVDEEGKELFLYYLERFLTVPNLTLSISEISGMQFILKKLSGDHLLEIHLLKKF